ncbi:MAG TPA: triple tyrosine motif-containing protein, partial [Chitinophagales bacterium]|nr:triple tyrosine motif-containing protein [Chitinophagales bacterium]
FSTREQDARRMTGLSAETIWSMGEDKRGNIWVCTTGGLDVITIRTDAKTSHQYFTITRTNIRGKLFGFSTTSTGTIYINIQQPTGSSSTFQVAARHDWDFHNIQLDTITSASFDFSSVREVPECPGWIWFIFPDTVKKQTWFFGDTSFICVDDRDKKVLKVIRVKDRPTVLAGGCDIDSNGLLLYTIDYSLRELNTETGAITTIQFDGFNDRKYRSIFSAKKDRSGTLWVATNGYGLLKHNLRAEKFHHTSDETVLYIAPAPNNCVYIPFIPWYWTFDPQKGAFIDSINYREVPSFGNGYNEYSFPRLDDSKHRRWIGYAEKLYCYDYATKSGVEYTLPVTMRGGEEKSEFQQQILEDHSGIIWIATRAGLFRFDEDKHSWKQFTNVEGDRTSLSTDIVFSLCLDPRQPEKYLWVGADGGGLNRMDITTGKFISYTTHDGLPNNVVYGVLDDDEGNLWLSTNMGLSCFDPEKKTFKNYEEKDGLQSNEFNHRAYCKTPNGWLFFGGVNGFNYFNPKEIRDNTFTPQVLITDVRIRNKPVSFTEKNSPLSLPVYLTKHITLPYSENMISFDFASMDFSRPGKNFFQYKLEGFDRDWIQSGPNHSATYTNLDPGTYTFLLKGSNSDGIWNEKATSMLLTILPPWYMTWWFRVAVLLAVAGALYAFYRYRLAQALKVQGVRNRIAQDLHDEIGANLSSISIFSQVAKETDRQSPELDSWLRKISDYTQSSLDAINDIVWMINSGNDRFENIISRMRIIAAELFEARNCDLQMNFDESLSEVKLGMEERKNFYLIYKEAINNIAKYANCKTVKIELKWEQPVVHLLISDDGEGFDAGTVEHGNGLLNMQKRAEILKGKFSIHSIPGKGTSVELDFNA